jgi:hypothetical protein
MGPSHHGSRGLHFGTEGWEPRRQVNCKSRGRLEATAGSPSAIKQRSGPSELEYTRAATCHQSPGGDPGDDGRIEAYKTWNGRV